MFSWNQNPKKKRKEKKTEIIRSTNHHLSLANTLNTLERELILVNSRLSGVNSVLFHYRDTLYQPSFRQKKI